MVDKNRNDSSGKNEELLSEHNILNKFQIFLDNNIQIIRNAVWIIGGIGLVIIVRRTYALHHFTKQSSIPEIYFRNNVTLTGKVVKVHNNGCLGILHLPLLWRARINYISNPDSSLLNVNVTGIELQSGGVDYLNTQLPNQNIKFQLLGKDECDNIESIISQNKGWLRRRSCINEEIISLGFATAKHVPALCDVKAYNLLIERLVKAEVKAVKKKSGIWKDDVNDGIFYRTWSWLKKKVFRR
ncbi:Hypothetical predicted protein [Paramuricea clavata]|uniref:Uncharacterized protein n=1 Tax=Paramuricea clavata TaxID=317549 RepID=A0A7D9EXZ3_PARCT|nr:Hypothetical predicted protein [Paramuricea clavata]